MTGNGGDAVASRRSSDDPTDDTAEAGIEFVSHVPGVASLSHILGRKWTTAIMITLAAGPVRHNILSRKLSGISRKVLHQSLRALMADGLVEKILGLDELGIGAVHYGLTPLGHSLDPVFTEMDAWCEHHLDEMLDGDALRAANIRVERTN